MTKRRGRGTLHLVLLNEEDRKTKQNKKRQQQERGDFANI